MSTALFLLLYFYVASKHIMGNVILTISAVYLLTQTKSVKHKLFPGCTRANVHKINDRTWIYFFFNYYYYIAIIRGRFAYSIAHLSTAKTRRPHSQNRADVN